jgi:tetratricopeptide (TPR) repeat protein
MTDFVGQNRAFWQSHPALQPFIAAGRVDFADFDAEHSDQPLVLGLSGQVLTPESVKNPVAVLANYFFNVLPSDLFHIHTGAAYESLATLYSTQIEPDLSDPVLFKRLDVTYDDSDTIASADYYDDPDFNHVLQRYVTDLDNTMLLYPMLALQVIRQFNVLSKGRLLLIIAEKGHERLADLSDHGNPGIAIQGGFSLMVNMHALEQYVKRLGGTVLNPAHHSLALSIVVYLNGQPVDGYFDTKLAYKSAIEQYGPDDLFVIKKFIEAHFAELTLEQILAYMRQSEWDGYVFLSCFSALIRKLGNYPNPLREDIHNTVVNIWARYFHIGEKQDLPFALATTLHLTQYYDEAVQLFEQSLALYGPDPNTFYNLASCYYELGNPARSLEYLDQTLAFDPDFASAHLLREQIELDQGRMSH